MFDWIFYLSIPYMYYLVLSKCPTIGHFFFQSCNFLSCLLLWYNTNAWNTGELQVSGAEKYICCIVQHHKSLSICSEKISNWWSKKKIYSTAYWMQRFKTDNIIIEQLDLFLQTIICSIMRTFEPTTTILRGKHCISWPWLNTKGI